jgi:4-cresol dehydrogenase (hydroxylating)
MINDVVSFTLLTQRRAEDTSVDGRLTDADLAALRRKYRVAPWSCGGGLYGTRAQVRLQRTLLRQALGRYGKLLFLSDARIALVKRLIAWSRRNSGVKALAETLLGTSLPVMEFAPYVHDILQGIPTEYFVKHAYFRHHESRPAEDINPARDRCGLTWFAPILPLTRHDVLPFLADCQRRFAAGGFDYYVALLLMNPRAVICLMAIIYDKDDAEQSARADALYHELVTQMQLAGYQQYRAALCGWARVFEDAPELLELNNRLKSALDPDDILAPGRYGIDGRVAR